ncbi:CPBP family intramembrane metalloprotease [Roseateles sp. DAIF2]|uniref:CPBP family intramembrane glutamic endopeptidase n=1 Tax=Roseateles sp. DAIF2 TaxID=2714952 RepID=UPI0018A2FC7C|nr:CPBP family intramembrane glutamic endopeptidase [Roseateles sp. DAIF2]QPF71693.1 CPBP family intramembrane metalloprotease [Roseateles sp. DAIF2]
MQSSNEHFPSVAQAALLLLANFLLQYLLSALLYDFRHFTGLTEAQAQPLVMVLAYGIVLVSVMHYSRMTYGNLLHSTKSSASATLMLLVPPVLLLVPLVLLLDHALMGIVEWLLPLSRWEESAFASMVAGNLPTVIATCVLAPILEEMLFRGVLLRAFLNRHPRWAAISYSALLFGAAHMNVYQFLLALWLGLLLGWLFERSRSLLPCIALHAAVNTAVVVLEQLKGPRSGSLLDEVGISTWLASAVAAGVGAFVLHRLLVDSTRRTANAV